MVTGNYLLGSHEVMPRSTVLADIVLCIFKIVMSSTRVALRHILMQSKTTMHRRPPLSTLYRPHAVCAIYGRRYIAVQRRIRYEMEGIPSAPFELDKSPLRILVHIEGTSFYTLSGI